MKIPHNFRVLGVVIAAIAFALTAAAQNGRSSSAKEKPVIFAVLYNGGTLEPIAYLENGKLESAIDGGQEAPVLKIFHSEYFKAKSAYALIFGGAKNGQVTVNKSDPASECERHTASVSVSSTRAKLKGNVMALATNIALNTHGSGTRRIPTAPERYEIEALVREELIKQKLSSVVVKNLKSQNLTTLDVDNDGAVELVGSYWVAPTAKTRALLFFIAEKAENGKLRFGYRNFETVDEESTMSGDITSVDGGVYHELLLDVLDYDKDGTSEVFTYSPSFEGSQFSAYQRKQGKWVKVFEGSNYRCGY